MNKKSLKVKVLFLFLILICFCLVINAEEVKGKDIVFAISAHAMGGDSAKVKVQGALDEIEKLGWKSMLVSAEGSVERHTSNIETLALSGNVDFIGIMGGDSRALAPVIDFAKKQGVPIVSMDAGLIQEGVITNVSSDNKEIGKQIARYLFEKIGGKGNIILGEEPMYWACRLRVEAMREVLKEYPNIKIVATYATQYPEGMQQAMKAVESILQAHPDKGSIAAVFADHDLSAVGATKAIMEAGRNEIIVGGIDADELSLKEYISQNTPFVVTMAIDYILQGKTSVDVANEYLQGKRDFPETIYMPTLLITRENAKEYIEKMWPAAK